MSHFLRALALAAVAGSVTACATSSSTTASGDQNAPANVQIPASVRAKAAAPTPPPGAKPATGLGSGSLQTSTANSAGDQDWIWTENIDITGDGQVEATQLLWDDEVKVLFLAASTTFSCTDGGVGVGSLLIGLYGAGNPDQQPVGSGVWAVELDKSECAAAAAGIFGCTFDANGNSTACGVAVLNTQTGELDVAAASD